MLAVSKLASMLNGGASVHSKITDRLPNRAVTEDSEVVWFVAVLL